MKVFFKRWIKEQKRKIKLVYPDIPEDDIEKFLEKEIDNNCKNPSCVLDNSYIHKQARASLLDIIDYIDQKKPILAGFGVMYKRQDQLATPEAIWLENKNYIGIKNLSEVILNGKIKHTYDNPSIITVLG